MITPAELQSLRQTWRPLQKPDLVPEPAFRLWLSAHALVNRRISIEQGAYQHAAANLYGKQYTLEDECAEYEKTLAALRMLQAEDRLLNHLWVALDGWNCYDPTREAYRYNQDHKIDRVRRATLLDHLLRSLMLRR